MYLPLQLVCNFITTKCHNICDGGMYYYTIQELLIKLTNFRM